MFIYNNIIIIYINAPKPTIKCLLYSVSTWRFAILIKTFLLDPLNKLLYLFLLVGRSPACSSWASRREWGRRRQKAESRCRKADAGGPCVHNILRKKKILFIKYYFICILATHFTYLSPFFVILSP